MVITTDPLNRFLQFQVDPGFPNAWKREPYYSTIKRWADEGLKHKRYTLIYHNRLTTLVLPDREEPLGVVNIGDTLRVTIGRTGRLEAKVERA